VDAVNAGRADTIPLQIRHEAAHILGTKRVDASFPKSWSDVDAPLHLIQRLGARGKRSRRSLDEVGPQFSECDAPSAWVRVALCVQSMVEGPLEGTCVAPTLEDLGVLLARRVLPEDPIPAPDSTS
jgi:hypothetical protein